MGLQATGRVWGAGARLCLRREGAGSVGGEEGCRYLDASSSLMVIGGGPSTEGSRRQKDLPTGNLVAVARGFVWGFGFGAPQ